MKYSPITLDKIRKSGGNTRIIQEGTNYALQVQVNGVWSTVMTAPAREICEGAVKQASGNVIIG